MHPDQVLEPYNTTLKTMGKSARQAWAEQVFASLKPRLSPGDTVVFVAGQTYREFFLAQVTRLGAQLKSQWKGCALASKCSGSTGI